MDFRESIMIDIKEDLNRIDNHELGQVYKYIRRHIIAEIPDDPYKELASIKKDTLPYMSTFLLELEHRAKTFAKFGKKDLCKEMESGSIKDIKELIKRLER